MIKIDDKTACSGCTACANLCPQKCISMKKDKMGFAYPTIDIKKCVDCGLCEKMCPAFRKNQDGKNLLLTAYAAQSLDDSIRTTSSSGGIFASLARYILSRKGVVFGAAFDDVFHKVRHIAVETLQDLHKIQGSKYVQSDVGSSYQEAKSFLEQGRFVLFSGTLCQIAGLKAFLRKEYENLYLIDVVCHGVPAESVWSEYIDFLEKKYNGKVTNVSFRDKRKGWRDYVISVKFDNGKEYINNRSDDLYMRGFLRDYYLRPSCFRCNYKSLNRASDITLGDLWGIEKICPKFDDNKGTSLVMVCSEKGRELFEKIAFGIRCCSINIDNAVKHNPAIVESCKENNISESFEKEFRTRPIISLLKKYCANSVCKKVIRKIVTIVKNS